MLADNGIKYRKGETLTAEQVQRIWQEGEALSTDSNEECVPIAYKGRLYQFRMYETGKRRTVVTGERVG